MSCGDQSEMVSSEKFTANAAKCPASCPVLTQVPSTERQTLMNRLNTLRTWWSLMDGLTKVVEGHAN